MSDGTHELRGSFERVMRERELKLSVDRDYRLPDLDGLRDGLVAVPRAAQRLSTVYFDSDDLRLARWGVSLRYRDGQGWTVKLPKGESAGLLAREEVVFAGGPKTPPAGAVDIVSGYLRHAALRPRVLLDTVRRGVLLRDAQGLPVADIVDDSVSVLNGRGRPGAFREVEIEITGDTPTRLLDAVVARLGIANARPLEAMPKYIRALGGPDLTPPEISLPDLSEAASLGDVIRHALGAGVIRLLRHDPVVRLEADPEGLHQARVATRRLRSDLRTFRSALQPEWATGLRAELGWLGGELGTARDADVLFERLTERANELPEASKTTRPLIDALAQRQRQAHGRSLYALRSDRYLDLIDRLIEAAQKPAFLGSNADGVAPEELLPIVGKSWRELRKRVNSLSQPPTDEELHKVRILAKRCRYAAEASSPSLGKRVARFAVAARELQDVLGDLNDAVVAQRWLRNWALWSDSGSEGFMAGEIAGLERAAAQHSRARWPKAWKGVRKRAPAPH